MRSLLGLGMIDEKLPRTRGGERRTPKRENETK